VNIGVSVDVVVNAVALVVDVVNAES